MQTAYQEMNASLPTVTNTTASVPIAFVEFSGQDLFDVYELAIMYEGRLLD